MSGWTEPRSTSTICMTASSTLPMMAERRAVMLDDPDIDKLSAGDLDKLLQILNDAVEPTVFIIAIKQNEFLPKKSSRCRKLLEAVDRLGIAAELGSAVRRIWQPL